MRVLNENGRDLTCAEWQKPLFTALFNKAGNSGLLRLFFSQKAHVTEVVTIDEQHGHVHIQNLEAEEYHVNRDARGDYVVGHSQHIIMDLETGRFKTGLVQFYMADVEEYTIEG